MGKQYESSISQKLIMLMLRAKRYMFAASEPWQLTPVQAMLLVSFKPGLAKTMNELSNMMCCDASNTTGLIDRLEAGKYIERAADPKDRRVKKIQLTPRGIKCRQFIIEALNKSEAVDLAKLSEDEIKALHSIMDKLAL